MLKIKNLHFTLNKQEILCGINLEVQAGTIHAIMGPNGSGKSTLASILAGKDIDGTLTGNVTYLDQDLLVLSPEKRAHLGLFLAQQYPPEIPGVNNMFFLKAACNSLRKAKREMDLAVKPRDDISELDSIDFITLAKDKCKLLGIDEEFLQRSVNAGFSGGEKKRNEILQMLVLDPTLAILDEPDSGLDIDALQIVARGINVLRSPTKAIILITHYQRLLQYVIPDYVHVLCAGKIIKSGGKELALELERTGYSLYA